MEDQENERSKSQRSVRNVDRVVKDLQTQIERRDKQNSQLQDDVGRMRDKADKLLRTIDELQALESANQLSARRAERELREEKDRALKLERELEGWKSLRMEKGGVGSSVLGSVAGSVASGASVRRAWRAGTPGESGNGVDVPGRKSSLGRAPSLTKGFL